MAKTTAKKTPAKPAAKPTPAPTPAAKSPPPPAKPPVVATAPADGPDYASMELEEVARMADPPEDDGSAQDWLKAAAIGQGVPAGDVENADNWASVGAMVRAKTESTAEPVATTEVDESDADKAEAETAGLSV